MAVKVKSPTRLQWSTIASAAALVLNDPKSVSTWITAIGVVAAAFSTSHAKEKLLP
jgi:hypothetical protein